MNPIMEKLLERGAMESEGSIILPSLALDRKIRTKLDAKKIKVTYCFDATDGKLVFDKVLGRDQNGDFYNEVNGNLEARKSMIKELIVSVIVNEYNEAA